MRAQSQPSASLATSTRTEPKDSYFFGGEKNSSAPFNKPSASKTPTGAPISATGTVIYTSSASFSTKSASSHVDQAKAAINAVAPYRFVDGNHEHRPKFTAGQQAIEDQIDRTLAMDGIIKPVGDVFWNTHSPRCRCTLRALSRAEAMQKGGVTQNVPADGRADEGWGHKPTDGFRGLLNSIENRLSKCTVNMAATFARPRDNAPMWCKDGAARDLLLMQKAWAERKGAMPKPRPLVLHELPPIKQGQEQAAFESFMEAFGGGSTARVALPSGDVVHLQRKMFQVREGDNWKIGSRGRDRWLLYIAELIKEPQEVWRLDLGMTQELYLMGRFKRGNRVLEALTVFKRDGKDGDWMDAKTSFVADQNDYLNEKRKQIMKRFACVRYLI